MEDKELDLYVLLTDWNEHFKKHSIVNIWYNELEDWFAAQTLSGHIFHNFPLDTLMGNGLIVPKVTFSIDRHIDSRFTEACKQGIVDKLVSQTEMWQDDVPELTDECFEKAWQHMDGEVVKEGDGKNPLEANTGGFTNYYLVQVEHPQREEQEPYQAECEDIIRALGMTFDEGCEFKAIWRTAAMRQGNGKNGNTPLYDAEKRVHYAKASLRQYQNE